MYRSRYCTNGHLVAVVDLTSLVFNYNLEITAEEMGPQHEYCQTCGAQTHRSCSHCNARIEVESPFTKPGYCGSCGRAFPWTELGLVAAQEYAGELDELDPADRETLKRSFADLISETPQTAVAALRFQKITAKLKQLAPEAAKGLGKIAVDLFKDEIKKKYLGLT